MPLVAHRHLAAFSELDGVAHHVGEDLADPSRVPLVPVLLHPVSGADKLQPLLLGAESERDGEVFHQGAEVKVEQLQVELARLNLGEIQDVVDDLEQGLGATFNGPGSPLLFVVQRTVQQQIGHADDAIHRRTDLVAHVSQEL